MIFIVAKFLIKREHADNWPELSREFTEATRAEPGNLWFDWARSVDNPDEYVLTEAFKDDAAVAHVTGDHFRKAQQDLPQYLQETPRIRNTQLDRDEWDQLGEFTVE